MKFNLEESYFEELFQKHHTKLKKPTSEALSSPIIMSLDFCPIQRTFDEVEIKNKKTTWMINGKSVCLKKVYWDGTDIEK